MIKVGVIDYGAGNQKNIFRAIKSIGCEPILAKKTVDLKRTDFIILPGMGSFSHAVMHLKKSGLFEGIIDAANDGKKILGICLGLQLFFENGDEGGANVGLGLLKGQTVPLADYCDFENGYKMPIMGWYNVQWKITDNGSEFSKTINSISRESMYFAHSYGVVPNDKYIEIGVLNYFNSPIVGAIKKKNILGAQFHPEKSGIVGLKFLKAFLS